MCKGSGDRVASRALPFREVVNNQFLLSAVAVCTTLAQYRASKVHNFDSGGGGSTRTQRRTSVVQRRPVLVRARGDDVTFVCPGRSGAVSHWRVLSLQTLHNTHLHGLHHLHTHAYSCLAVVALARCRLHLRIRCVGMVESSCHHTFCHNFDGPHIS
jgi:hypothetical protein